MMRTLAGMVLGLALVAGAAVAEPQAVPDRPLADAGQEARARDLFKDIRCVVCQHESISDSPAAIAADMRALVREQISAGKSDSLIREDLVRRYGDYVLFTPPVRQGTWFLWFGPFVAVAIAAGHLIWRSSTAGREVEALSPQEEFELAGLMAQSGVRDAEPNKTDRSQPPV